MKKTFLLLTISLLIISLLCGCGISGKQTESTEAPEQKGTEIQRLTIEASDAIEAEDMEKAHSAINKLIAISTDSMYSKKEQATAMYLSTFLHGVECLHYIDKNDPDWIKNTDLDNFLVFHAGISVEFLKNNIPEDDMNAYIRDLVSCIMPIHDHYTELTQ